MLSAIVERLDRLLANLLLAGARRRWPLLALVPPRLLRPVIMPTARRVRLLVAGGALVCSLIALAALAPLVTLR
jgi:hypothetical protein